MRFAAAIFVSVAIHALLAVAIIAYLEYAPGPKTLATLDLSSVELSFSEEEDSAAVSVASTPAQSSPMPKPALPPPPEPPVSIAPPEILAPLASTAPQAPPEIPETPEKLAPPEKPVPPASPASPAAPAARQARIDAPPRQRSSIKPDYPKKARQRGEQGDVVLELAIGKSGNVDRVSVVGSSGFPELDAAAVAAAKKARFTPAKSGDSAVASTARLKLTFQLK